MNKKHKEVLSLLSISPKELEHDFGVGAINRGISYFNSGKVIDIDQMLPPEDSKDELTFSGKTKGSYGNHYQTTVSISPETHSNIVSSRCSCPVHLDCKHGIALLFTMLEAMEDIQQQSLPGLGSSVANGTENSEIDLWLQDLQESDTSFQSHATPLSSPPENEQYHGIYLLDMKVADYDSELAGLNVRFVKARALKKGGYGQIYSISISELIHDSSYYYHKPNYYHTEIDVEIARCLSALQNSGYGTNKRYFLEGELGNIALKNILKTRRCMWKSKNSDLLTEGANREINLKWSEEGGMYETTLSCVPPIQYLFTFDNLYYLDENNNECGTASHPSLRSDQIAGFMNAPAISKKQAEEVSKKIAYALPDLDLPLPVELNLETIEIKDTLPIIHLTLHASTYPSSDNLVHLASLSFEYADIIYEPTHAHDLTQQVSTVFIEDTRYRIHRQLNAENDAIETLKSAGFSALNQPPFGIMDMVIWRKENINESVLAWDHFQNTLIPELVEKGWIVDIDDSFDLQIEDIDDWFAELEETEGEDWFELSLGFEFNGKPINLLPLLVQLLAENPDKEALHKSLAEKESQLFQLAPSHWVKIPTKRILQILDTIIELYDTNPLSANDNLIFSKHAGLHLNDLLNDPALRWKGADELKELNEKIRNFSGIESVTLPSGLQGELRDYQKQGLDWLQFLRNYQFNGILADDMGLGKTIQTLCNILLEKEQGRADLPSLVIAPTSLMGNWKKEAARFTPDLKVLILQGPDRRNYFSQISEHDIILTTYPLILRDKKIYEEHNFHYLVLDEAQAIKNAKAKSTQVIYSIHARHRLCVTGTPMENHLGELWSMYHFLMPGYLGMQQQFTRLFRTPIEKHGDNDRSQQLRQRIEPFMLRRTKDLVAKELPEKTEIIRTIALTGKQRDLYETVRVAMDKKVRDEISKKGLARSHIMILDALLKLRQVCCDPRLVKLEKARKVKESAKLDLLMTMVPEMVEEGRRILIFSQFTTMLSIIEKELNIRKISYTKLTGRTQKRTEAIDAFQEGEARIFLISLKAGGVGLNLTAADTVIHYDPWWNPAVERQATDRAHRLGQDKPVFVYKLLTEDTVEEKILKMQERKQALADSMYANKGKKQAAFDQSDLMDLLKPIE